MQHAHELALFQKKQHHIDDRNTHQGQDQFLKRFSIRQYSTATHSVSQQLIKSKSKLHQTGQFRQQRQQARQIRRDGLRRATSRKILASLITAAAPATTCGRGKSSGTNKQPYSNREIKRH